MSFTFARSSLASYTRCSNPTILSSFLDQTRYSSSLSAVWKGLRKERSGRRGDRAAPTTLATRRTSRSRDGDQRPSTPNRPDRVGLVLAGGRKHFKIKKALKKMEEREMDDEGGRKSRSKRFNNPEFGFGKKSLVYQLNQGDMKEKITKLVDDRRARLQGASSEGDAAATKLRAGDAWSSLEDASNSRGRVSGHNDRDRPQRSGRDQRGRPMNFGRGEQREYPQRYDREQRDRPQRFGREERTARNRRAAGDFQRDVQRAREELTGTGESGRTESFRPRDRKAEGMPTALPYTTAASQFLFGRWPVTAALREGKRKLYHLYVYENSSRQGTVDSVRALAEKRGVRVTVVPEARQQLLDSMSKGRPHNGMVLETSPLPQLPIESLGPVADGGYTVTIAHQSKEELEINGSEPFQRWDARNSHKPLILLLHEVMDPGNLGAILRTARFLGAAAVAITKQTSSPVTNTVVKAAAGAAEEMTIFSVADPASFLEKSREAGWDSYVAVAPSSSRGSRTQTSPEEVAQDDPLSQRPCIVVMGNEGEGLSRKIISQATHQVTIARQPTLVASSVDSLNVSVAAALLCDAFTKGMRSVPRNFQDVLRRDAKRAESGESLF